MIGEPDEVERGRGWMVSFADLISLMLSFMVMLFAMSTPDNGRWTPSPDPERPPKVDTLAETLDWPGRVTAPAEARLAVERTRSRPGHDLDYLASVLTTTLAEEPLFAQVRIERRDDTLVVALPETLLFAPGATAVADRARPVLAGLAQALGGLGNRLALYGHTDLDAPSAASRYASNWELSLARALAVADVLRQAGLARPVTCYGLAETRYNASGEVPESRRRAIARRVDLIVFPAAEVENRER